MGPSVDTTEVQTDYTTFIRSDGNRYCSFLNATKYWLGASQIDLKYDTEVNKFYLKYLHMPLYDSGNNIVSRIGKDGNTDDVNPTPYFHAGKNGGVAFHNLRAQLQSDQSAYDFWSAKLGFDVTKMCVRYDTTRVLPLGGGDYRVPVFVNLGDGVSTVAARPDIDSLVINPSVPRYGPGTVWGLGTGPATVHWSLDEHP